MIFAAFFICDTGAQIIFDILILRYFVPKIYQLNFWLVICIAKNFIWTTLKMIFSISRFFFAPSDSRFSNIVQTIHQWKYYLFSFRIQYKSQFWKIDSYDWFCAPGSHMVLWHRCEEPFKHLYFEVFGE